MTPGTPDAIIQNLSVIRSDTVSTLCQECTNLRQIIYKP